MIVSQNRFDLSSAYLMKYYNTLAINMPLILYNWICYSVIIIKLGPCQNFHEVFIQHGVFPDFLTFSTIFLRYERGAKFSMYKQEIVLWNQTKYLLRIWGKLVWEPAYFSDLKSGKFPDHQPFFIIGWPSEKSSDVARTRLGPVSQIVNRLAPEFFLAEMLRV